MSTQNGHSASAAAHEAPSADRDAVPARQHPAGESQSLPAAAMDFRLTYLGGVEDLLEVDDHLIILHTGRVIALAGLTREIFSTMHTAAAAGRRVRSSRELLHDICVQNGAAELPPHDAVVALQELSDLDLLRVELWMEDA